MKMKLYKIKFPKDQPVANDLQWSLINAYGKVWDILTFNGVWMSRRVLGAVLESMGVFYKADMLQRIINAFHAAKLLKVKEVDDEIVSADEGNGKADAGKVRGSNQVQEEKLASIPSAGSETVQKSEPDRK